MAPSSPKSLPPWGPVTKRFGKGAEAEDRLLEELAKKYRIVAQLGEGGTARVWLAMARGPSGFNKLVVLKTIRGELFDDPAVVDMFLEEARLAARLNHPHIVQTNEVFEQADHPVIVMEYLDGVPFSVVLERQREGNALALAMLLRILSDALAGLHAAHELTDYGGTPLSVVHRDVSPHNLFVTFAGQVKVLDFGIAVLSTTAEISGTGVIKGKLRYIAPEQLHGDRPVDRRADIYSLGVILWEVATASRMWTGVPEPTIMKRITAGDLPRATDVNPDVDREMVDILDRALATNPEDRYPTALDFQADLDRYLAGLGGALRNRDIGRALSKMFDDVRTERSQTIESQLARTDTIHDVPLSKAPLPELTSFSNVRGPQSMERFSFHPGPRTLILFAFLAMCAFVAVLFWPKSRPAPPNTASVARAPAKPSSAEPERQRLVEFRVTAFPGSAELELDGEPLLSNPYVGHVGLDKTTIHELKVTAPGYRPEVHTVVFERNLELVLTLKRAKTEPPARAKTPPSPKPRIAPRPAPAPVKPDCTPPYYYDDRGVKKYRPECL